MIDNLIDMQDVKVRARLRELSLSHKSLTPVEKVLNDYQAVQYVYAVVDNPTDRENYMQLYKEMKNEMHP